MEAAEQLKNACLLWLPSYLLEDEEAAQEVAQANGVILDFLDHETNLKDCLEKLFEYGIEVDSFLEHLETSLIIIGG